MRLVPESVVGEGACSREVLEVDRIGRRVVAVRYRHPDGRVFVAGRAVFEAIVRGAASERKPSVPRDRSGGSLRKSAIRGER